MPTNANYLTYNGIRISASEVVLSNRKGPFFCCTENCRAKMILVNGADPSRAYFRSEHRADHISRECIKNALVFSESDYNEDLYDNNFAFESILGLRHSDRNLYRGNTGSHTGAVGGSRNLRIHTLPKLVAMCLHRGKSSSYNSTPIDDILVDGDNYDRYKNGIRGYRVVEVSYFKKVYQEHAFLFNCPADNKGLDSWVKVVFPPDLDKLFWQQYRKCQSDSSHSEILYIAGKWEECRVSDGKYQPHSYCIINSSKQIYWAVI